MNNSKKKIQKESVKRESEKKNFLESCNVS